MQDALFQVEADERYVDFFYDSLKLRKAKHQNEEGQFRGHLPRRITKDDIRAHLSGEITLGFPASKCAEALFLAIECDRFWGRIRKHLAPVLGEFGLDKSAFLTTGSDPDRGKVVIWLKRPIPQAGAHRRMKEVWTELVTRCRFRWEPKDIGLRPSQHGSSLLRIGGRNRKADRGAVWPDQLLGLDGKPLDPSNLVPGVLRLKNGRERATPSAPYPQKFVFRWLRDGWEAGDRSWTLRCLNRLAFEAVRCYGRGASGEAVFLGWASSIEAKHPELSALRNKARSAWAWARHNKVVITYERNPIPIGDGSNDNRGPSKAVEKLVETIVYLAESRGLNDLNCVSFSQREIGEIRGVSQQNVSAAFRKAVKAGRIVVHDPGTRGETGYKAIFGIVLPGQTAESVAAYGARHHEVVKRKALKVKYGERRLPDVPHPIALPEHVRDKSAWPRPENVERIEHGRVNEFPENE